jgi:predicted Zn finger-like uncharacterized protein
MILTCPACATRYSVPDGAVGPHGKAVRCAGCSHRWTALPETESELELAAPVAVVAPEPEPTSFATDAEPERSKANTAPLAFREKVVAKKTVRRAVVNGVIWAGIGAAFVVLIAAALIFRVDVVKLAPRTASAYAALGMPVNPIGLVFEGVMAKPGLQDGHDALVVSGAVRNIEKRPIAAPSLAIRVLDKAGHAVLIRKADNDTGLIAPGQTHNFVVAVLDPPATANDVEVAFGAARPAKSAAKPAAVQAAHAAAAAAEPALRGPAEPASVAIPNTPTPLMELAPGPAPTDAKPVPTGSPYALRPPHG